VANPIDLFRQIIERGFNQGDLTVADEICYLGAERLEINWLGQKRLGTTFQRPTPGLGIAVGRESGSSSTTRMSRFTRVRLTR
jgi:hypothetical protein